MEVVQMVTFDERMSQWRKGELSDGEILAYLLMAQAEVAMSIKAGEEAIAEHRMRNLNIPPYSAT